ncbi:MAG: 2-amino-4-hydroxy-6-hydroxymethyldihydropteridine diphosphokinase, partial [Bacteroidota bacterium]
VHDVGPLIKQSSLYETEPWGMEGVNLFLNQVIQVKSTLQPVELLGVLQGIEEEAGRIRDTRYGIRDTRYASDDPRLTSHLSPLTSYLPRSIDIDILFYGELVLDTPELTIPHPLLAERRFVLVPLAEIEADLVHPVLGKSMKELLACCRDSSDVSPHQAHRTQ